MSFLKSILSGPQKDKIQRELGIEPYNFLEDYTRDLLITTEKLLENYTKNVFFDDYSFLVCPAAKAFEGYLKKLIRFKNLATGDFIVGNIFDPKNLGKNSLVLLALRDKKYKRVIDKISGEWDLCRNKIMHYDEDFIITAEEARKIYLRILEVIKISFRAYIGEISYPLVRAPESSTPQAPINPRKVEASTVANAIRLLRGGNNIRRL